MGLNHVYKVVWNKTKGCYVVVSELAKRVGRNKAKAIVISSAAIAMAVSPVVTSTVGAAPNQAGTGPDDSVAWGADSTTVNQAVAVGKNAKATGDASVAIGKGSKAEAVSAVALGEEAKASQARSIAIGKAATIVDG